MTEDDIPPEELEMVLEEFTGKDTPGEPTARMIVIEDRMTYLAKQHQALVDLQQFDAAARVLEDLLAARQQLARLQANHEERN